jgi:hypothetical protein
LALAVQLYTAVADYVVTGDTIKNRHNLNNVAVLCMYMLVLLTKAEMRKNIP